MRIRLLALVLALFLLIPGCATRSAGGGVAATTAPVAEFAEALLAGTEGIFTDACYSGKIFHGFLDLVRSGKIPDGENAIFLHSGGTPAIWSKEHLDLAQSLFYDGEGLFVHKA